MAHRDNRAMTGSNTIPLGGIKSVSRAAMGGGGESLLNPSYLTLPNIKRERELGIILAEGFFFLTLTVRS